MKADVFHEIYNVKVNETSKSKAEHGDALIKINACATYTGST
jgi:hypothetical protein